jgi:8-oxo-dGTP pyrophosphatase MutT (NUDIX family)
MLPAVDGRTDLEEWLVDWDWTLPTDHPIQQRKRRVAFKNHFITVFNDRVLFADKSDPWRRRLIQWATRRLPRHLRIEEKGGRPGAAILATCGDLVALVLVYRYPQRGWEWGIPRGFAHSDHPEETAAIELHEELGDRPPDRPSPMGIVVPNSGLLAGHTQLFHAQYAMPMAQPKDKEVREVRWVPVADLGAAIAAGYVTDGFTLSALTAATIRGIVTLPVQPT